MIIFGHCLYQTFWLYYLKQMFQKYLEKMLKQILGQFIEEIDSKELSIGIWSGKVEIKTLKLKKNIFQKYNVPIVIKHSSIKGMSLKIPWKNLFGSPLVITIQSLVILCEFSRQNWSMDERAQTMTELINKTIKKVGAQLVKSKQKSQSKQKAGLLDQLTYKMLDNLFLSIKNIHFRFEEDDCKNSYSFGCSLQSIEVFAVNANNEKVFVDRNKLQTEQTKLRKKIQMKNLSVYCNCGEQQLISRLKGTKHEKSVQQKLLKSIYSKSALSPEQNKNNYILIMNVLGYVDEIHKEADVKYDLNMHFQKLFLKINKELLTAARSFANTVAQLNYDFKNQLSHQPLAKEDEFLLRKYCDGYLGDFKNKSLWANKDSEVFKKLIGNLSEAVLVEKIEYIIVHQMSVNELAKFFALKGEDLQKGLMEASKQIKDIKEAKISMSISVPQITLYLVNEFSQSILEFNILQIDFHYRQTNKDEDNINRDEDKVELMELSIFSISAINNNIYILNSQKDKANDTFLHCKIEKGLQITKVQAHLSSLNLYYDYQTIYKITDLFHLQSTKIHRSGQLQLTTKSTIRQKEEIDSRTRQEGKVLLEVRMSRGRVLVKEGRLNWSWYVNDVSCVLGTGQEWKLQLSRLKAVIHYEKREYVFIHDFDLTLFTNESLQAQVQLSTSPILFSFEPFIIRSLSNLYRQLFISKKNEIVNKSQKTSQIFVKQTRWRKSFITLYKSQIYSWENQSQYPLFNIELRHVAKTRKGNVNILRVSDKKLIYQIAFKDDLLFEEWYSLLATTITNKQQAALEPPYSQQLRLNMKVERMGVKVMHKDSFLGQEKGKQLQKERDVIDWSELYLQNLQIGYKDVESNRQRQNSIRIGVGNLLLGQKGENFLARTHIQQGILSLVIHFKQGEHHNSKGGMSIEISSRDFEFAYKSDAILRMLGLFTTNLSRNQRLQALPYVQTQNKPDINRINTSVQIQLTNISITFHNKITQLALAQLAAASIQIELLQKCSEYVVKGMAANVQLYDLTNYPNTIFRKESSVAIQPRPILYHSQPGNSISFDIEFYGNGSLKIKDNIKSIAQVTLTNARFNYINQVLMRLIDYLNVQILGLIFYPQFFPQYKGNLDFQSIQEPLTKLSYFKTQDQLLRAKFLKKMNRQFLLNQYQNEMPLHFHIQLINTQINLVSDYSSPECIRLHVQKALLYNSYELLERETEIGKIKQPWDIYKLQLQGVQLWYEGRRVANGLKEQKMWVNVTAKLFNKELDYRCFHKQKATLPYQLDLDIHASTLTLHIDQHIYRHIFTLIDNNVFHQDGLSFLFFYQNIIAKPSPLNTHLHSQLIAIQLQQQQQTSYAIIDLGALSYDYSRLPQTTNKVLTANYLMIRFLKGSSQQPQQPDEEIYQILASHRFYQRFSNKRSTYYEEIVNKHIVIDQQKDSVFRYQSTQQRESRKVCSVVSAKEILAIIDIHFVLFIYQFYKEQPQVIPIEKALNEPHSSSQLLTKWTTDTQLKLQKIIICAKVANQTQILSLLATIYFIKNHQNTQIILPDLEIFIANQQNFSCQDISEINKRTLLRQTTLNIIKNHDRNEINLGKCFFKISVKDLNLISQVYSNLSKMWRQIDRLNCKTLLKQSQILHSGGKQLEKQDVNGKELMMMAKDDLSDKKQLGQMSPIHAFKAQSYVSLISQDKVKDAQKGQGNPITSRRQASLISQAERQYGILIDTIQLMIVDDLRQTLTPLLYSHFKLDFTTQHTTIAQFYADYFNLRNAIWEPIIEHSKIVIQHAGAISIRPMGQNQREFLNVNIASNFIENVIKSLHFQQLQSSRMIKTNHLIDKDAIDSWILINELGEDLICQSVDKSLHKSIQILNGEAKNLYFLSASVVKDFKQQEKGDLFMRIVIGERLTIKKLKISEMGIKRLNLGSKEQPVVIIKKLYIDLSKNIKYLTLSSEIVFCNKSNIDITFKENKHHKLILLAANKTVSLPYYTTLSSIFYNQQAQATGFEHCLQALERRSTIVVEDRKFNIVYSKKKFKKYFDVMALYKISNYLPFDVIINFKFKDRDSIYEMIGLKSYTDSNGNFGYLYHPLQQLEMNIVIDHYHYHDFQPLAKYIELKDKHNLPLTVKCQQYQDHTSLIHIALTVNYIITNQTNQLFDVFVDKHWQQQVSKGDHFISESNEIILSLNGQKSQAIQLPKKHSQISIKSTQQQPLFTTQTIYCIYKNKVEINNYQGIKNHFSVSQILPMYLFFNDSASPILLKQLNSAVGQVQRIGAKGEQNLIWYLQGNGKRRTSSFRLSIENSAYEWSYLMNIQELKKVYFTLRNKCDYRDIKYCMLSVKKVKQAYIICFKLLSDQQIPYLIINNTANYHILIEHYKVILKGGEKSHFSWEDPNINNQIIKLKLLNRLSSIHNQTPIQSIQYYIQVDRFQQHEIKSTSQNIELQVINQRNTQIYMFNDKINTANSQLLSYQLQIQLPIRIALINNSISPASHLVDITTHLHLELSAFNTQTTAQLHLQHIQIDNQTKPNNKFPVILSTDLTFKCKKMKRLEVEVVASWLKVNIEEQFFNQAMVLVAYLKSLMSSEEGKNEQQFKEDSLFISKLILPKMVVELEIQTNKLSLETTINLQKPQITSYPWKKIPYPINTIIINILSNLSISPWAFLSSFGKGLTMLITEEQTSRGVEGLFQQLIGGFSNSVNGIIGVIVGHDIEKVDNFIDGLNKGLLTFGSSLLEILPMFQGDYSPINVIKEIGTSAVKIFFKPVTGILRMTLKISEGIKKTTQFQFNSAQAKFKSRSPIVFYQREEIYYAFDSHSSDLFNAFKKTRPNELKYFYLIDIMLIEYRLKNERWCLAIGAEQVVLFNLKSEKIGWSLQIQKIGSIEVHNLCTISLVLANPKMQESIYRRNKYQIETNSQQLVKKIVNRLQKLKNRTSIQL